jgi:hypothetical protein
LNFVAGAPTGSGELHFHREENKLRPHLAAYLHINNSDGWCARARLDHYDNSTLLETRYSTTRCMHDNGYDYWHVDVDSYADRAIDRVKVTVEKEDAQGWSDAVSETYSVNVSQDEVKITDDGVDFGGADFSFGEPGPAAMWWSLDHGDVTPQLWGYVHLNNSSGVCARVNVRYQTEGGTFLYEEASDHHCASDNSHQSWPLVQSSWGVAEWFAPLTSDNIGQAKVQLQTLASDGDWENAGSKTVSIAE